MPSASSIRHKPSSWDCASIGNVKQRHRKDTTVVAGQWPIRYFLSRDSTACQSTFVMKASIYFGRSAGL